MPDVRVRLERWEAVVVGYAALAALCRPLTVQAAVAVALPGIALVVLAAHRPPRRGSCSRLGTSPRGWGWSGCSQPGRPLLCCGATMQRIPP